ncbi:hypothetical protein LTR92_011854, partial [Exophiala xenobiotica]
TCSPVPTRVATKFMSLGSIRRKNIATLKAMLISRAARISARLVTLLMPPSVHIWALNSPAVMTLSHWAMLCSISVVVLSRGKNTMLTKESSFGTGSRKRSRARPLKIYALDSLRSSQTISTTHVHSISTKSPTMLIFEDCSGPSSLEKASSTTTFLIGPGMSSKVRRT